MNSGPGNSYWLMTFGDLLTLLLCFFVAIVSLSRHQHDADLVEAAEFEASQITETIDEITRITAGASHGAKIALDIDNRNLTEVLLEQGDVDPEKHRLNSAGEQVMEKAIRLVSYPIRSIVIETCSRRGNAEAAIAWHESVSMSLGIQRQIHDMSVGSPQFKVRSAGPYCNTLGLATETQVSRILIQGTPEETNGR